MPVQEYTDDYRVGIKEVIGGIRENREFIKVLELGAGPLSTPVFIRHCNLVISIDLKFGEWVEDYKDYNNWSMLEGDDIQFMNQMLDSGMDFSIIYIDSSHKFEHTSQELELASELLEPGGVILMHDVSWAEVARAIELFIYENDDWGFKSGPRSDLGVIREINIKTHIV